MKHPFLTAAILGALAIGLAGCGQSSPTIVGADSNGAAAKAALASASPVPVLPSASNAATSNTAPMRAAG